MTSNLNHAYNERACSPGAFYFLIGAMKTIKSLINWIIIALVFLLPLFFLPTTLEFYIFNKQTLLLGVTGILLILWMLDLLLKKELRFKTTSLDLPIIIFALAYVLATIFASPNKVEALMESTSVGTVLILTVLYFVITNNFERKNLSLWLHSYIFSAGLLGLIAIYQFLGLGEAFTSTLWMKNRLFTPAGGPLILASYLAVGLILAIILFLRKFNREEWLPSLWYFIPSIFIALGLGFTVYQILPGKETSLVFLPYRDSWAVAIESFKQNPLFGVGPGNYLSAFNRFRPITYNAYEFWNFRLGEASNFPLQILTVGGLVTLAAYLFLLLKVALPWVKRYRAEKKNDLQLALLVGLLALFVVQLLLPINLLILASTFFFLAFLNLDLTQERQFPLRAKTLNLILLGIVAGLTLASFYLWGRVYAADFYFRKSLNALEQNQGIQVYNHQIQAIAFNPYLPLYRRAYAQTNFALANSIASKGELSDQDRTNITQLIQQAIREAKAATALNQIDAANWENLSQIYRNLINFAQGADQWAIAAYQQAIFTDPLNPRIRVNFGGLLYALGNFEAAARQFQNAVDLKPDYANGYYNLSAAYRERKMYQEAYQAMQIVVNLIPADSPDYQTANDELSELAKKLPAEATAAAQPAAEEKEEVLVPPEPLPSPAIKPPIELPEESGPEVPEQTEGETTPEVSPTPTP